ncbi:sugar ABC transporter permease [Actinomadura luteofluorescens]|uniref:carbohydrate ABC transporter permease n=1 Tax=Actinomadura luteofluorescens TaxID=46163 RepID=UPI002164AB3D|nr:sugar ABC transporter permease [Actinomadura glauciflava]MCR3743546.1 carbohydrate ABC transporter membrane protein 1, CUT1 family (TC 3.A.1.1.-) [Actinomadura glauciflava]
MTSEASGSAGPRRGRLGIVLVSPTLVLLAAVIGFPIVAALVTSFRGDPALRDGFFTGGGEFAGFSNYLHWVAQRCGDTACPPGTLGGQFWTSVLVTLFLTVVSVSLEVVLGLLMAIVMNQSFLGRGFLRAVVLVPWAIPTAVTAKLWFFMFSYDGVINRALGLHVLWTDDAWAARFAVIISDVWKTTPFVALLILAGMAGIPGDLYEAARIDGAGALRAFSRITLPLVRPALLVAVVFRVLDVLRIYDLPAILTHGGGGDGHATTTLSILTVQQLRQGYGGASALSTLTFLLIFGVAMALVRVFRVNLVQSEQHGVS